MFSEFSEGHIVFRSIEVLSWRRHAYIHTYKVYLKQVIRPIASENLSRYEIDIVTVFPFGVLIRCVK